MPSTDGITAEIEVVRWQKEPVPCAKLILGAVPQGRHHVENERWLVPFTNLEVYCLEEALEAWAVVFAGLLVVSDGVRVQPEREYKSSSVCRD